MLPTNPLRAKPVAVSKSRYLLSRAPGILFATAALLVSFSGVAASGLAPEAYVDASPPAPLPAVATDERGDTEETPDAKEEAAPADGPASRGLSFKTGDRLTEAQQAEFAAYIAELKAQGLHRGHASYSG